MRTRSFLLEDLATRIGGKILLEQSLRITGVCDDSRRCRSGDLFVALNGNNSNGIHYIEQALANGAVAVLSQDELALKIPQIVVTNVRIALSKLAAHFFSNPSSELIVVGITGTNGKTTTNWMIYHLLTRLLGSCMRIGTLGNQISGQNARDSSLTTPGALELQSLLAEAVENRTRAAVLEVSSHALSQSRVDDINFDVAVFTNLTQDHLDYHNTLEEYFFAKQHLFELTAAAQKNNRSAVINISDPAGARLASEFSSKLNVLTYGWCEQADIILNSIDLFAFEYGSKTYELPRNFVGKHNIENMAAALGTALILGFSIEQIITAMQNCPQVPGRLELLAGFDIEVIVDYAHTPDALRNALSSLRENCKGTLWAVFGCGGDRDKGKRPLMGEVASTLADKIIVTSDNPRTEDPREIVNDILKGCPAGTAYQVDRKAAIEQAIAQAKSGDMVLIAGKGHEAYQIIGTKRIDFSDQQVAMSALKHSRRYVNNT